MAQEGPLNVVASFSILGDFAAAVGGEHIALTTIVGSDSDAHVYEPRPADAVALAAADVVLTNGLNYEGFLDRLIEASGTTASVVAVSDGIAVLAGDHDHDHGEHGEDEHDHDHEDHDEHDHGADNPHAWQSVAAAKIYVANIAAAFCAADAAHCADYEANAAAYDAELTALDGDIRAAVDAIPEERRTVVVAHNAYQYFERDYGIHFLSPVGISTAAEASAADVATLVRQMRDEGAVAIFAENIADPRLVEQIAAEAGLSLGGTLYSDSLSGPDGEAPTYLAMMRANLAAITAATAP
jgi:zinc/manganese transport system substrate-binding protein